MAEHATYRTLFHEMPATAQDPTTKGTGVFADVAMRELIATNQIVGEDPILEDQIQPASLDLRLGRYAYRVRASFLPGESSTVMDKLSSFTMHRIDLSEGAVLERGCVYIVPLLERLQLQQGISALTNPKSSTGRLDIFTRVITDYATSFDKIGGGHRGPLFLEVAPRTFSVLVRKGTRLSQIRFQRGSDIQVGVSVADLHKRTPLISGIAGEPLFRDKLVGVTIDLEGGAEGLVGYRAKKHSDVIDLDRRAFYEVQDFWEPIHTRSRRLILDPDDFYILVTREAVTIPPDHAAEMVAYDTMVGEFRVHYAGFFDPGFGHGGEGQGSRAVLEVRSHEVPFLLEHGQTVGWLRYERLTAPPAKLYGAGSGSNYQKQGLQLAKQFKRLG